MKRVLLVIDVQNDYFSGPHTITHPAESFTRILDAIDAANDAGIPVILVRHAAPESALGGFRKGTYGGEIAADVLARPYAEIFEKHLPGSFTGTPLESWLRKHEIETVTIAGYMTQMCCDTTSRQALHLGFRVEFLSDATGTHDFANSAGAVTAEELHRAALVVQASRFADVMTVRAWTERISAGH
jgi:nicotinamidase-related amidase